MNVFCKQKEDKILDVTRTVTNEFIDSLEELRVAADLPRFVLAGHSLGGYLSTRYALKYPDAVEALVLISPAGIEPLPPKELVVEASQMDWKLRIIDNLWKMNFTPQNIVRLMGPKGPGMVTNTVNRRFASRWQGEDLAVISDYLYHISAAPGNGEYALNALLEPKFLKAQDPLASDVTEKKSEWKTPSGRPRSGVYARLPLEADMCNLKMPVLMLFGDTDWLAYPTAAQSVALWRKHGVNASLEVISGAGHHLYTDNSVDFNRTVVDWVKRSAYLTSDSESERVLPVKTNLIDIL
eukprot:gene21893-27970_t